MNTSPLFVLINIVKFVESNIYLGILFLLWSFYWKGRALWKAARENSMKWFIALLIINTLGILEILYIFVFGREKKKVLAKKSKK